MPLLFLISFSTRFLHMSHPLIELKTVEFVTLKVLDHISNEYRRFWNTFIKGGTISKSLFRNIIVIPLENNINAFFRLWGTFLNEKILYL